MTNIIDLLEKELKFESGNIKVGDLGYVDVELINTSWSDASNYDRFDGKLSYSDIDIRDFFSESHLKNGIPLVYKSWEGKIFDMQREICGLYQNDSISEISTDQSNLGKIEVKFNYKDKKLRDGYGMIKIKTMLTLDYLLDEL